MTTFAHNMRFFKTILGGFVQDMINKGHEIDSDIIFFYRIYEYLQKEYSLLLKNLLSSEKPNRLITEIHTDCQIQSYEIYNKFIECLKVSDYLRYINFFSKDVKKLDDPECFFLISLIDYLRHPHTPLEIEKALNNYRMIETSFLNHSVITPDETIIRRSKLLNYERRKSFLLFFVSSCCQLTDVLKPTFANLSDKEKDIIVKIRIMFIKENECLRLSKYTVFYSPNPSFRRCIMGYL